MEEMITGEQGLMMLTDSVTALEEMIETLSQQVAEYERVLRWYSKQYAGIRGPAFSVLKQWNAALSEEM